MPCFSPKISPARVFDLTRRSDEKQPTHLPKAVEMADRGSAGRGTSNSFICGGNRVRSGITGNTTSCNRFHNYRGGSRCRSADPSPRSRYFCPAAVPIAAAEFIEPQKTVRVIKAQGSPVPIRPSGQTRLAAVENAKAFVLSAPRPDYPCEARSRHITGSGVAVISVDPNSGLAVDAMMEQSIGNPILDNSTVSAFRRWRFKPGRPARVRIPITFVLTGAQY